MFFLAAMHVHSVEDSTLMSIFNQLIKSALIAILKTPSSIAALIILDYDATASSNQLLLFERCHRKHRLSAYLSLIP